MNDRRVLIVEDEAISAMAFRYMLEAIGLVIAGVVARGDHAVELCEREHPDLVLMDIKLRSDMDGVEAARLIRARHGIPVILVTAYSPAELVERRENTLGFPLITKPVDERELSLAVISALESQGDDIARPAD
jgi:CheY-like chemotaxis protein